jgi:hypothetical protein
MRKKLTLIFTLIVFTLSAQSVIKISPISLAFGSLNFYFEQPFSLNRSTDIDETIEISSSLELRLSYTYKLYDTSVNIFGVNLGYKAYISEELAPEGLYIMPNAGYGNSGEDKYKIFDFGLLIGFQYITNSRWAIDCGAGIKYTFFDEFYNTNFDPRSGGVEPRLTLAVGYAIGGKQYTY